MERIGASPDQGPLMPRFLLTVVILMMACSFPVHGRADENPEDVPISPEFEMDDDEDDEDLGPYIPVEWPLLQFHDERRITKATLVLRDKGTVDAFEDGTTVEFDDPKLLARLQECFRLPPLRLATPDDGKSGIGWGSFNVVYLQIETTQDKFFIDVGSQGFHLNRRSSSADTIFWQGKLARLIDEVYFEKTKKPLRPGGLTLAESHVQFFVNWTDMRPEVSVPSDEKVQREKEERRRKKEELKKRLAK